MSKRNKRLLRMGFILLAVLLCVSLIALPGCSGSGEQQEEKRKKKRKKKSRESSPCACPLWIIR